MMKLSEAILLGSTKRPHAQLAWFSSKGTCALGAALDAVGLLLEDSGAGRVNVYAAIRCWPWLGNLLTGAGCLECGYANCTYMRLFVHLNDKHGWSRPRIAALVAAMEPNGHAAITTDKRSVAGLVRLERVAR